MAEKDNNKKRRRSPAFVAGLVLLFLGIVILLTLAMFASFDEVTNVFEAGKVDIVLTETKWDPKDGDKAVPNTFIPKNPTITNKEETVDTYVFMKVTVPYDDDKALIIEKAYQDELGLGSTRSGSVAYENTHGYMIPIYEFVATGEKSKPDTNYTAPTPAANTHYNFNFENAAAATAEAYSSETAPSYDNKNTIFQEVNPGWYLLKGFPQVDAGRHTITYLYAHVLKGTEDTDSPQLQPLWPNSTTEYPLFNEIYYLNFRERTEDKSKPVTAFPNPGRDY
ncbi:MAG: hypothetical protein IJU51_07090, partial [Clostridia bacterium]|nr:hypothetical protein [Clostridia bacterium]